MVRAAERALGRIVAANNARLAVTARDAGEPNPRDLRSSPWATRLAEDHPRIRSEWDAFVTGGGRLPRLSDLLDEDQGEEGTWRAGVLVSRGRAVGPLVDRFPDTVAAALAVPGIWSALWSVLDPGASLPPHRGPNAGVLRYHLGVDCPDGTALEIAGTVVPYRDRCGILFDDTDVHAAWNRSRRPRTTLFLEVLRPAAGATALANRAVQRVLARDPRYRDLPRRAEEWDAALNG